MLSTHILAGSCVHAVGSDSRSLELVHKIANSLNVNFSSTTKVEELLKVVYDTPSCVVCTVDTDKALIQSVLESSGFDPLVVPVIIMAQSLTPHEVVRYMEQRVFKIMLDDHSEATLQHWVQRALIFDWDRMTLLRSFKRTNLALGKLSMRQLQVLKDILKGKPTKSIASHMNLSQRMIEKERSYILSVFGVNSTSEVTRKMGEYRVMKRMQYRIDPAHNPTSQLQNHLKEGNENNPLDQFLEKFGDL